jgi:aromatic ring hydroxylase
MLKSIVDYLEQLRDGRSVYIGNEITRDVTELQAFRHGVRFHRSMP